MRQLLILLLLPLVSCGRSPSPEVVVYASIDEVYAREIFDAFRRETGIEVKAVYDTEEAKTLGLVHRLIAERNAPQADVFWNGECVRTALLKSRGVLDRYVSPVAQEIGPDWRDPDGFWIGFGARARVIVINTDRVKKPPRSLAELADPAWRGRVAIANPVFGTTATHIAALARTAGEEATLKLLESLKRNEVRIVGGNSHVRDLVARGDCDAGLTDTDDVWIGRMRGDPIDMVFPDQEGAGTLAIPNTVAIVKGAPRPDHARRFIDFLLRPETEALLARGRSRQMPVRRDVAVPDGVLPLHRLKRLSVDWPTLTAPEEFLEKARRVLGL